MRNTMASSYVRPTIWTPVGTPLDAHPDGTASTGQRLKMLNAMVMIVSLMGVDPRFVGATSRVDVVLAGD